MNYENFRHYRSHRTNDELLQTSDTIGVTEPKLNYDKLQIL